MLCGQCKQILMDEEMDSRTEQNLERVRPWVEHFLQRMDDLVDRLDALVPPKHKEIDWAASLAFHWQARATGGFLKPVTRCSRVVLEDLQHIDRQKQRVAQNTRQFVKGQPANHVLLTGARGTGKSSLVKACLNHFASDGLRLIEVDREDLHDLPAIAELIASRKERFIVFCDDLSFEAGESSYKALKVALDGSISAQADNMLIYATSNRRHLLPEDFADNQSSSPTPKGEIHPGEGVDEKIALSERFGLWAHFYPFKQDEYLDLVQREMERMGCASKDRERVRAEALIWALERGSRSGRVATQFVRDWCARIPRALEYAPATEY